MSSWWPFIHVDSVFSTSNCQSVRLWQLAGHPEPSSSETAQLCGVCELSQVNMETCSAQQRKSLSSLALRLFLAFFT